LSTLILLLIHSTKYSLISSKSLPGQLVICREEGLRNVIDFHFQIKEVHGCIDAFNQVLHVHVNVLSSEDIV